MRPHLKKRPWQKAVFKLLSKISLNVSARLDLIKATLALQGKCDSFGLKRAQRKLEGAECYTETAFRGDEPKNIWSTEKSIS